jgi:hypothetical protein
MFLPAITLFIPDGRCYGWPQMLYRDTALRRNSWGRPDPVFGEPRDFGQRALIKLEGLLK